MRPARARLSRKGRVGQKQKTTEETMGLFWRAATAALMMLVALDARAAEIKVLCIPGLRAAMDALLPQFERTSGDKVTFHFEIYPKQTQAIEAGDFDVAIFATPQIADLSKQNKVVAATVTDIARTRIGVAVKSGAPKPDIDTEAAFKATLLAAKSITYTKESQTGVYLTKLFERIGIADAIKDKLKLQPGGAMTAPAVAKGEAELGIVLVSDILATSGIDLVGPLPESLQNYVMQTAALGSAAKQPAAGAALIKYLASTAAAPVFDAKGLQPPPR
jgi:molybdate transport system substrate-binding protein